jgi:cytochrome c oxidase subunit 2
VTIGTGARRAASLLAVALLLAGCLPSPATEQGRATAGLYLWFVLAAAIVALIVYGTLSWTIVRHRRRHDEQAPDQVQGNLRLEIAWTAGPIILVVALFAATLGVLTRVEAVTTDPAIEVRVEAFRWGWSATYPETGATVSGLREPGPEIVLPVDVPIRITLVAADVVHAFYVPAFLFKRDAIPGRESVFELTIAEAGSYGGQCAEFCGVFHSRMPFTIRAVPRPEFEAWLAAVPGPSGTVPG